MSNVTFEPENPVESDDDKDGCCHWSTTKEEQNHIAIDEHMCSKFGKNAIDFPDDTTCAQLIDITSLTDERIDSYIDAINEYGATDDDFRRYFGVIPKDDRGRSLIRGFLSIKWHMGLLGRNRVDWIFSDDTFRNCEEIKKVMARKPFEILKRCFRYGVSIIFYPIKQNRRYNINFARLS